MTNPNHASVLKDKNPARALLHLATKSYSDITRQGIDPVRAARFTFSREDCCSIDNCVMVSILLMLSRNDL